VDRRFRQHAKTKWWWFQVARNTVEWYPNRTSAEAAEKVAIQTEHPVHNIAHAGRRAA